MQSISRTVTGLSEHVPQLYEAFDFYGIPYSQHANSARLRASEATSLSRHHVTNFHYHELGSSSTQEQGEESKGTYSLDYPSSFMDSLCYTAGHGDG